MKNVLVCLLISMLPFSIHAQLKSKKNTEETVQFKIDSTAVLTLDNTIKSFYNTVSGIKGKKRNWKQFRFLFKPEAKLILSGKNKAGRYKVKYMTPDYYVKSSKKWLFKNGLFKREIHRETDTFANIAHVFSSYKSFYNKKNITSFVRGTNSIQLLHDGKRWWIINLYWSEDRKNNPIVKKQ